MPVPANNFIVYKSSAGSGKTFTLVKEYLKLALKDKQHLAQGYTSILAVTFTNKAAAEMKWRIIKALKELSEESNDMLTELLCDELSINRVDLKYRSEVVLTAILHNYSDFSVSTIDSFTHRIIRTFALDLKLPINFQIETDVHTVFKKVIALLMNDLGKNSLITDYLVRFSLAQVEDNKHWDPEVLLLDFIKEIHKEGNEDIVQQLARYDISDFEHIRKKLADLIKQYEQELKFHGAKALSIINDRQLQAEAFSGGHHGIHQLFVKLAKLKETTEEGLFKATVYKTLHENKWYSAKATPSDQQAIDSIKGSLQQIALQVLNYLKQHQAQYTVFTLIHKNIYAMGLINELVKLTSAYKATENMLFISEFNQRISTLVTKEPTPFIFERLGNKYKHFLLDEFQDTSVMQWQNMLPLVDNSLASGHLNLVVGDGKQSIYRWRNANVEQFVDLPAIHSEAKGELLMEREDTLMRNFNEQVLIKNYRSQPVIVAFNNALFKHLPNQVLSEHLKKIYHRQEQEMKLTGYGLVSLDFPELMDDNTKLTNEHYVLHYIQQAIEDGYHYSDICVIVRQNKHGNAIANCLIDQDIPVVSAESLLLNHAEEITVILSFLKYCINQKDTISGSVVLNHLYLKGICTEEQYIYFLRELNHSKEQSLFSILAHVGSHIDTIKLTAANLFDSCTEIITVLRLNETNPQYIRFFLDEVLTFLQSNTSNVSLFIDWWHKRIEKASVIIPEGINAVNIMTIHASKGLEFPVVISPYVAWNIEKTQPMWVPVSEDVIGLPVALMNSSKSLNGTAYAPLAEKERDQQALDSLNMLYVNFTRAVERLHIISPQLKKASQKNCHTWLYEFALSQKEFNSQKQSLVFGERHQRARSHHPSFGLPSLSANELVFNDNTKRVQIKGSSLLGSNEEVAKARHDGILVHYILSQIKSKEDLDVVIERAHSAGIISDEEAANIKIDVKEILDLKSISSYFETGVNVKNELEILTSTGAILRPDRVVIQGQEAVVIDYKTGKKSSSKYHAQMKDYENALLGLGYASVKKILVYIHEREVEQVIP